jgi:hypothetical protein
MEPADSIRKLGFRRWYERQLIEGHVYLVTCVLAMVVIAASLEEFSFRSPGLKPFLLMGLGFGGVVLSLAAFKRYRLIMTRAERYGDRSTCAQCKAYSRFDVIASGTDGAVRASDASPDDDAPPEAWLRVRCRKCGNEWTMP